MEKQLQAFLQVVVAEIFKSCTTLLATGCRVLETWGVHYHK
jgi:hypothetical protein